MENRTFGKLGAAVTGASVFAFAVSMLLGLFVDTLFLSCLASMFIAIGFVAFMAALYVQGAAPGRKAAGITGMAFGGVYAVLVLLVYFAQCTTVRLNQNLSREALSIISYGYLGSLFFNYDLLGYAFMALSTFLMGLTLAPETGTGKALKTLLMVHGVFFLSCLFVPMFPVFTPGTSSLVGTLLLEVWCLYFLPVCVLGFRYFAGEKA